MKGLHGISFALVIIGALNWGLVAVGTYMDKNFNIVNLLLGAWPSVETLVYLLVGLAAIFLFVGHKHDCRACGQAGM